MVIILIADFKDNLVIVKWNHDLTMYDTFGCPFSFESPENKAMARKVLGEVQSVYGKEKWKKAVIKGKQ